MSANTQFVLLLVSFIGVLLLVTKPLGIYIADVMEGRPNFAVRAGARLEGFLYRLCAIDAREEMSWHQYAIALLLFNVLGAVIVYGLQRLQFFLPLNPQKFSAVSADSSFNTAVSFITNTNWQGYSGESTMGYLVQMAGLAVQNFLSAATGIAVAIALIRGFARHGASRPSATSGWTSRAPRSMCCCRSPACSRWLSSSQGVIQNFERLQGCDDRREDDLPEPEDRCRRQSNQGCGRQRRDRDGDDANADAADGTGRLAGGHQGTRHQRGRILQREFRRIRMRIPRR